MIKKFNDFLDESVRDMLLPVSKEEIQKKLSNNFLKTVMEYNEFSDPSEADVWISEHIDEIIKLIDIHSSDEIMDRLCDMTDFVKRKFNLEDGGIVDNGWNRHKSVIVTKKNIEEVFNLIKSKSHWSLGGDFRDIVRIWDTLDKFYGVESVKLTIPRFSRSKMQDGRFKNYLAFVFDIGKTYNPVLVFDTNSTNTPYIWRRTSNASWSTAPLDRVTLEYFKNIK